MHRFVSPAQFQRLNRYLLPAFALAAVHLIAYGLYLVFFVAPLDYQQGITVRIMYLHVPSAWMATGIYAAMTALSLSYLIWKHPLAALAAREAAAVGALFTALCLASGMLWGKPMWGAYWVWDARLTSVFILLLIYLGYMALHTIGEGQDRTHTVASWLCVIGAINLPIIKFSVEWWNTLHQPASILRADGPSIHASMLTPLLIMLAGFLALAAALVLLRMSTALKQQKLRRLQIYSISHTSR
jgi:heme exporter protein C